MTERNLLYVDDDKENLATLRRVLRGKFDVTGCLTGTEALARMEREPFPVIVSDQRMPEMTGVALLKTVSKRWPETIGLLLTAYSDLDALVDGVNASVIYRYLTKPWREEDLLSAIKQAYEKFDLVAENKRLLKRLEENNRYLEGEISKDFGVASLMSGCTKGLQGVVDAIRKVAPTNSSVLIRGESGVGKELVARAIHENSPRRKEPFVRVNCGALAEGLLESELFGHEKGAFTGAADRRVGRFELADGGTLFLDEIGDISPKLQVSLLRVLQEKEFERVGGNETLKVDVRVIAATHRDLEEQSRTGKFRQDLYYRLNVFPILIPPLRDRLSDLPKLIEVLLEKAARTSGIRPKELSDGALVKLQGYDFPGNIRELENLLERALILSSGDTISEQDVFLGPGLDAEVVTPDPKEITREQIENALREASGNKVEAARRLGIKRPTLYYHLKKMGMS